MMAGRLSKLVRMDAAEIAWRGGTAARTLVERLRTLAVTPRWSRADLLPALAPLDSLAEAREALKAERWDEAQHALAERFARAPRRFTISPSSKPALVDRIHRTFPDAAREAAARAERILAGDYDLLGYRGLRFDRAGESGAAGLPDWTVDSVHHRRPPMTYWAAVPYLDPACGDHKIIWELNRHQHWIALGRAWWLTGERRFRARFLAELASWLDANPPLVGVNWASMLELSFRSISWLWALNLFAGADGENESPWIVDVLTGIDRQLLHVEQNLSYYFSPNTHLLGEALALYVCGCALPELAASARRTSIGRRILLQEIDRQIAADGGHCERSTHYHRYTLDFYALALVVARNTGDDAAPAFEDAVVRLGSAARLLADDRGRLPHIGDDDGGVLLPLTGREPDDIRDSLAIAAAIVNRPDFAIGAMPEEALWIAGSNSSFPDRQPRWGVPSSAALPATGYYVSRSTAGDHLVLDGGPHGFRNGGHAHADALSMTLAVRGVPLLIDPGTACYTTDLQLRDRMRSSALHNTMTVDGRSQSLSHGAFQWSHVANGTAHRWRTAAGFDYFDGSHDGYRPLEHRRRVLVLHGDLIVVADFLGGSGTHAAAVHWHLDPRWCARTHERGASITRERDRVGLSVPQGTVDGLSGDDLNGLGWYSPAYGRLERTTTVRITHQGAAPFWMVSVFDLDAENAVAAVDWAPVWSEPGAAAHTTAIRITRAASVDHVLFAEPAAAVAAPPDQRRQEQVERTDRHRPALWRVDGVETDACMLFFRSTADHPISHLAFVDGSVARAAGRHGVNVSLPAVVPAFFSHPDRTTSRELLTKDNHPCAALPVS